MCRDTLNAENAAGRVRPLLNEGAAGMCPIQTVHLRCAPSLSGGLTRKICIFGVERISILQADYLGAAPVILL